jgi:hypothetical protein
MLAIIQDCFVKCGFGTADSVDANNHDESEEVEPQRHIDFHSAFDEFLNVNKPVLPQVISRQVWTALAAACDRRGQGEDGGYMDTSCPSP